MCNKKPVSWFQGLLAFDAIGNEVDDQNDTLSSYLTIGSKRMSLFKEERMNMHFYRLLQAVGKNASDVHSMPISRTG